MYIQKKVPAHRLVLQGLEKDQIQLIARSLKSYFIAKEASSLDIKKIEYNTSGRT